MLLCAWLLAGCGDAAPTITPGPTAAATTAPPTAAAPAGATVAPATATEAQATATAAAAASPTGAAAVPSGPTYQNPVLQSDFPDPFVLHAGDAYYAYATNGSGANMQRAKSPDLVHWR